MALNLSTLTNASTSATVLSEAQTTADFLDSVPILKNIARGSNKGGDGKQTTALNQPKALPLIDGKGYCYLPATTGNAPAVTFPTIGASDDFVLEMVAYVVNSDEFHLVTGANANNRFLINYSFNTHFFDGYTQIPLTQLSSGLSTLTVERSSGLLQLKQNGVVKASLSNHTRSYDFNHLSFNGQFSTGAAALNGYIQKATLSIAGTEELNIDFTATNIRHNDTKFKCATGQTVTINQAGNDPATVIKKPVLRFANLSNGTTSITMKGLFANHIDSGYMFAAFSVLGNGGENYGRIFSVNKTGASSDSSGDNGIFSSRQFQTNDLRSYYGGNLNYHAGLFDDANGDILHEVKLKSGDSSSKVNNADSQSSAVTISLDSNEFNISQNDDNARNGGENPSLDLEFLALFPATITDAEAARVVNYINTRNTVFDLKDGFGHYFYDGAKSPVGNITDVATWNGRIVGSDNGDADKLATQATGTAQPVGDGYKVTFADNTDFLTIPSTTQAGWQICGTSLGTFAYRVNGTSAVTELNLLGNLGNSLFRKDGDLYGIILLPESATGADIEEARKLLIDRGAADGASAGSFFAAWAYRADIVNFKFINTTSVTAAHSAWWQCTNLEEFQALDLSNSNRFESAWQGTTALTSFPAGAKLGTAAENVNFTSAWQSSGLTSFPALDLSNGNNFSSAFKLSQLTSFTEDILLGTNSTAVRFDGCWMNCSGLTAFPNIDLSEGRTFNAAWWYNTSLEHFPALFTNWNPSTVTSSVFHAAWTGCSSLSSTSVENILISIDSSGVFGTYTGLVTGTALPDAGIDIDYDVATGALSAATNTAIASLRDTKGWSIFINGAEQTA